MKVAIIGGKLQGTEAAYLARAAGFESILIDKNPQVPAAGLACRFVCGDVVRRDPQVLNAMREADLILPANENDALLDAICEICKEENLPLAFDREAYRISESKIRSDRLFHENHIPSPRYFPEGKGPYIAKPSEASGSVGVRYLNTREDAEAFLSGQTDRENWIVQEFLQGPSYSIEVIGVPGNYRTYTVTEIHMDDVYDCCRVTAPCSITEAQQRRFSEIGKRLAELVRLHGIMDVEVIDDGEDLKVLEIDARLPSQTPIAVYHSSGINLLEELADITIQKTFTRELNPFTRFCSYEHYRRQNGRILQEGEHMMAEAGLLSLCTDFCGSREILWDLDVEHPDKMAGCDFRGIFVNWETSLDALEQRRSDILRNLKLLP